MSEAGEKHKPRGFIFKMTFVTSAVENKKWYVLYPEHFLLEESCSAVHFNAVLEKYKNTSGYLSWPKNPKTGLAGLPVSMRQTVSCTALQERGTGRYNVVQ